MESRNQLEDGAHSVMYRSAVGAVCLLTTRLGGDATSTPIGWLSGSPTVSDGRVFSDRQEAAKRLCELEDSAARKRQGNARIVLDVDGILAGFTTAFCQKAQEMGVPFPAHFSAWNTWVPEGKEEGFKKVWEEIEEDDEWWLESIRPLETAHVNFDVAGYVTARPVATEVTKRWLDNYDFPGAPVKTVPPGGCKKEALLEIGTDVYVDDRPKNVRAASSIGIDAYLLSTPANYIDQAEGLSRLPYLSFLPKYINQ